MTRRPGPWLAVVVVAVLGQATRPLYPVMYELGEDWDFLAAGLVALGVAAAPIVAALASPVRDRSAVVIGTALLGTAWVVPTFAGRPPVWLSIACPALAWIGAGLVLTRLGTTGRLGRFPALVVIGGLALDTLARVPMHNWDLAWAGAWFVVVPVVVAALVLAVLPDDGRGPPTRAGFWFALGPFTALHLLFVQNAAAVGAQSGLAFGVAASLVLLGGALAVAGATLGGRPVAIALAGLVGAGSMWLLPQSASIETIVLVPLAALCLGVLLGGAGTGPGSPGRVRPLVAMAGGSVLGLALVLVWALDVDRPLPFPRELLLVAGVLMIAAVAFGGKPAATTPVMVGVAGLAVAAVLVAVVPATDAPPLADPVDGVRVVSLNARGGVGPGGYLGPDRIVDAVSGADVVVLQEVARGWPIHGTLDLLAFVASDLGMEAAFAPAADPQFGNAVLSRLPMRLVASGSLPPDGSQGRSYLWVELDAPGGPLQLVATHLHSRSVPQIEAVLGLGAPIPLVLAGDMNVAPDDPEVALFEAAGLVDVVGASGDPCRTTSAEPTRPCDRPDWVFVSGDLRFDEVTIGAPTASDHLPISVRLP